jgi:hypothetical protein
MQLLHYSNAHIDAVLSTEQTLERDGGWKPRGLWVTVPGEDDWPSWCRSEDFRTDHITHATEVILRHDANLLHLSSSEGLRVFHNKYSRMPTYAEGRPDLAFMRNGTIDWPEVAKSYGGILIAPYIWEVRLDTHIRWYYSWDCASGCIWDASMVKELRPVLKATT